MPINFSTNVPSLSAARGLSKTSGDMEVSLAKLAAGQRIINAAQDAAGLAIATQLGSQVRSLNQAARNAQDGLSLTETAEAGLNETTNLLQRARELATQAASSTVNDEQRGAIQEEIGQILSEVDRIANSTEFNGQKLLDGSGGTQSFQVGIDGAPQSRISVSTGDARGSALGVSGIDLSAQGGAQAALGTIDGALSNVSSQRARFGAVSNRLESATSTIRSAATSLSEAKSRLSDTNVAEETGRLAGLQIQTQASVAVLAQANQLPGLALRLLR